MANTIDIGIDLGTTNSVIARHSGGEVEILRNPRSLKETLPSVVAYRKNRIIVGDKAREYLERDHENVVGGFKRKMGTAERFFIKDLDREVSPVELSAQVLMELKSFVHSGEIPDAAVITIPASFDTMQSNATREAGLQAGFHEVSLLQEPIAASLAFANRQEKFGRPIEKGQWLVYDLGGGTFDVALVRLSAGEMRVIDHEGNNFLGGADFDDLIVTKLILPQLLKESLFEDLEKDLKSAAGKHNGLYFKLLLQAEEAKISLSAEDIADVEFEATDDSETELDFFFNIHRKDFEALIDPYIDETIQMIERILIRNELEASDLDFVLMVGGSTYIPRVRQRVAEGLGIKVNCDIDPTTAVGEGAAFYAATKPRKKKSGINLEKSAQPKTERAAALKMKMAYARTSKENEEYFTAQIEGDLRNLFYRIERSDKGFDSGLKILEPRIEEDLPLIPDTFNTFQLSVIDNFGNLVRDDFPEIGIAQGKYAVTGQPLPQDICIEVDDLDNRRTKLEAIFKKNEILPLRRTITKQVIKTIPKGADDQIVINILEGSSDLMPAVNLPIGFIVIKGSELDRDLLRGSDVEITVEISESRDLNISASLLMTDQDFSDVFAATERQVSIERLIADVELLQKRAVENQIAAKEKSDEVTLERISKLRSELDELQRQLREIAIDDITDARYQLDDRKRRLARSLSELTQGQELEHAKLEYFRAKRYCNGYLEKYGTDAEKLNFAEILKHEKDVLRLNNLGRISDLEQRFWDLSYSIRWRTMEYLSWLFGSFYAPKIDQYFDRERAEALILEGNEALEKEDVKALQRICNRLSEMLPSRKAESFNLGTGIA